MSRLQTQMIVAVASVLLSILLAPSALPEDIDKDRELDLSFISRFDQSQQFYVLWLPAGVPSANERIVIVALHGHGADRMQFIRDSRDECRAVRDVARQNGAVVLSPDYRAKTSWMGPAAEADVLQLLKEYRETQHPNRVILCGGSMGAASALTFAALHPESIDGVIAMNGIANHLEYALFQDSIRESFGGSKNDRLDEYKKRSAEYWPERLHMPIGFTVGGADTITPPDSVTRLAGVLTQLGRDVLLIQQPEGGHATNYDDARTAIDFVLNKTAKPARESATDR